MGVSLVNSFVLGLCLMAIGVMGGSNNCLSELQKPDGVLHCMTKLGEAMMAIDPNNPGAICTDATRKNMQCMTDFVERCQSVLGGGAESPLASIETSKAEFNRLCGGGGGGQGGGTPIGGGGGVYSMCAELQTCLENAGKMASGPEMTPGGQSTPFSMFPVMVFSICKVSKAHMACLDQHRDKCPEMVAASENGLKKGIESDEASPFTYSKMLTVIAEDCPNIPADFSQNRCVREKLEATGFTTCMNKVAMMSAQAPAEEKCKFYFQGKSCIETHIGKPCGAKNAEAMVNNAYWIIKDLPQNCPMPDDMPGGNGSSGTDTQEDPTGGASVLRVTFTSIAMALMMFVAL